MYPVVILCSSHISFNKYKHYMNEIAILCFLLGIKWSNSAKLFEWKNGIKIYFLGTGMEF